MVSIYIYIYIYNYVCGRKKNLNRTLEIDSPFQMLTVGLLVEFIDYIALLLRAPEMVVLMEVVAVERELGSGQGDIMTRTPNSK